MTERTCEGCRWFRRTENAKDVFGECRRFPPLHSDNTAWLSVRRSEWCGEWADGTITADEADRQELVRQFAAAIVQGMYANPEDISLNVMQQAHRFANVFQEAIQKGQQ